MPLAPSFLFSRDPFADMRRLQRDMGRLFAAQSRGEASFPAVNLWTSDDAVAVTLEIPGVAPDALDISVREDVLTIAGERSAPDAPAAAWSRRERAFGAFSRRVRLPFRVDGDTVDARFRDGALEIVLRRPDADKPRKIAIQSA